jgi:hypothetical protein
MPPVVTTGSVEKTDSYLNDTWCDMLTTTWSGEYGVPDVMMCRDIARRVGMVLSEVYFI